MKKIVNALMLVVLILSIFISCTHKESKVYIKTDRSSYELKSSSAQGIKMTPDLQLDTKIDEIQYHWIATGGTFIDPITKGTKIEVINSGETVLWSGLEENSSNLPSSIDIILKIENKKNNTILAEDKLTITRKDDLFTIIN